MIEIDRLSKSFGGIGVIRDISLRVQQGERLVVLGPNGAGKTTLLRLIAGELAADRGKIRLRDRDITGLPVHARARAGIGRSFQRTSLFETFTIRESLILAASAHHDKSGFGRDPLRDTLLHRTALETAAQVGLEDLDRQVSRIDHGTRRRLDIAIALTGAPDLLLLDEPASGIGPGGAEQLHSMLAALPLSVTMIVVEHDLDLAFAIADRIAIMDRGQIRFHGTPDAARPALREIYDA
ncbi:ATP-binding cassette domain-containing protein [Paracoccus aerodenitrificans]|nr:ATP-binding cassette domain-containing protein [Paracoccus aerodenitrificans]WBU64057.1 ATP-binding cassette domain-containing protein [Paracoccus aerodenitrificans]